MFYGLDWSISHIRNKVLLKITNPIERYKRNDYFDGLTRGLKDGVRHFFNFLFLKVRLVRA